MKARQGLLRVGATVDGGLEVPKAGLGIALRHTAGLLEDFPDGVLGRDVALFCRLGVPLQSLLVALLDAAAQLAAQGVFGHALNVSALGGLEEVLGGRLDVDFDVVVAVLIDGAQLVGGIEIGTGRVGHLEPLDAAVVVLGDPVAVQVAGCQLPGGGSEASGRLLGLLVATSIRERNAGELSQILNGETGVGLQTMSTLQEAARQGPFGVVAAVFGSIAKNGSEGPLEVGHLGQVSPVGVLGEAMLQRFSRQGVERIGGRQNRILFFVICVAREFFFLGGGGGRSGQKVQRGEGRGGGGRHPSQVGGFDR
mmetsp:Transcript_565/g.1663  ORF Transcript_565/g.1663 Transcript_565/m.1663 type:complete len:310 (+) Transcript_565:229-1158(+)